MPASTGSATLSTSTVRAVVSPLPARSPVVSTRVTATTTPSLVAATPGSARTPRATGVTVKCVSALAWFGLEDVGCMWLSFRKFLSQTVSSALGSTLMQTKRL